MQHETLCSAAGRWLAGSCQCGVVLMERATATSETPDAIGWRQQSSILVECKTSRADFLADAKKPYRRNPETGMGRYRVYLTPPDLLTAEDLPDGWSLYEYCEEGRRKVVKYKAGFNVLRHKSAPPFVPNQRAELTMVLSAMRRIKLSGMCMITEWPFLHVTTELTENKT